MHKIMTIVGARPQFVKAAAVSRALLTTGRFAESIVHTGQHFDDNMSSVFFDELEIPEPTTNLHVHGGSHGAMTGDMLRGVEAVMSSERPEMVIVYGDTNSTLAGALAAAKLHVPIAHVEAGLRSFNRRMPEEINRVLTDHVSTLLFCPTFEAVANLRREGIERNVHHVGDVMYDATLHAKRFADERPIVRELSLDKRDYVVCTVHRAENTDDPVLLDELLRYVQTAAKGRRIVFPVHPRTARLLEASEAAGAAFTFIEPVGYLDMAVLIANSQGVFTDSGGLQKEAYFHGVPCVTLRGETEWVETINRGWNRLWRTPDYESARQPIPEYGDGDAATLIVARISDYLR